MQSNGIRHFSIPLPANKGSVLVDEASVLRILGIVMDRSNHPLLIHCNKGKHRTGCVVGCFRKCQGKTRQTVNAEYHRYADPKARVLDEQFIDSFDERGLLWMARTNGFSAVDEPRASSPLATRSIAKSRITRV